MEEQRSELSDIQEFFKRRAEIEKKYSRDLEGLFRTAYNKHKDVLRGEDVPSSTAILRELVKETKFTARNHAVVEQIFGTVILGRCQNIGVDVGRVYKQVSNFCNNIIFSLTNDIQSSAEMLVQKYRKVSLGCYMNFIQRLKSIRQIKKTLNLHRKN